VVNPGTTLTAEQRLALYLLFLTELRAAEARSGAAASSGTPPWPPSDPQHRGADDGGGE
jgi:hypothetical protein